MTAAFAETIGADADIAAIYQNFETLSVSIALDAVGDDSDDVVDLGDFEGINNFVAAAGVLAGGTGTVNNVANNGNVTLAGNLATADGELVVNVVDAAMTVAAVNVTLNSSDLTGADNDIVLTIADVETVNLTASSTDDADTIDSVYNVDLTADEMVTFNIDGDQGVTWAAAGTEADLETVNGADATGVLNIDTSALTQDVTITGGAGDDVLEAGDGDDTIAGGEGNDTITGGEGADALSGGAGSDIFAYNATTESTLIDLDVITGFVANTFGQGAEGAATDAGADIADIDDWTGDVIDLSAIAGALTKIDVSVQSNAADAQTFLQNLGQATADTIGVALDSSSGRLYIDVTSDGTVDSVIQLTGVTTIDEAAFII